MKFFRGIRLNQTLLATLTLMMLLVPAYAQQEINPTWYDPWAKPSPAVPAQAKLHKAHSTKVSARSSRLSATRNLDARDRSVVTPQTVKTAALRQ